MECPICFNLISNSAVGSCCHHFCYECLLKWCSLSNSKCPVCKDRIYEIKLDREFDKINNPECLNYSLNLNKQNIIKIDFSDNNILPGITLKNNSPGVKITKLQQNGICYKSGLNVGDIILSINNVPCNNHKDSVKIIDNNFKINKPITLELLKLRITTVKN